MPDTSAGADALRCRHACETVSVTWTAMWGATCDGAAGAETHEASAVGDGFQTGG